MKKIKIIGTQRPTAMPSPYGALTETVGYRLVGPTPRTPTGFGYADGGSGTPTGVNADGKTPTASRSDNSKFT